MRTFLAILADITGESWEAVVDVFYRLKNGRQEPLVISPFHTSLRAHGAIAEVFKGL